MKDRKDIDIKYQWSIDEMMSDETFETRLQETSKQVQTLTHFKGQLTLDSDRLAQVLNLSESIQLEVSDLYTFAHMKQDENTQSSKALTQLEKATALSVKASTAMSFIEPELLGLDEEALRVCVENAPNLKAYDHMIKNLIRQKQHVLSQEEERILAMLGDVQQAPQTIFGMLNNADLTFGEVVLPDGKVEKLTQGSFTSLLEHPDQGVRKTVFDQFYKVYEAHRHSISAAYMASVKKDVALSGIRGYESARHMALDRNNVSVDVYDALIEAVHQGLPAMHAYVRLRKKMLGVDELHIYDVYTPLLGDHQKKIAYDDAYEQVMLGLKPLGETYQNLLAKARDERWIDVYETTGKRSGAYSWGTYRSKPYILLNYQETLNDVFTLAHELGHSMHSYFSNQNQPSAKAGYSIFVAEVASTVNEAVMMRYLLEHATQKEEKRYLLNHFMDQFKGTVFRQTMFAEFEKHVHHAYEQGNPLNYEDMSTYYMSLNRTYFGEDMVLDEAIKNEWMRIPHFYGAYYVYQYATGFAAAIAISEKILANEPGALEGYMAFLKTGGSMYPLEALKLAGVDMSKPDAVHTAMRVFKEVISEFEANL